MFILNIAHAESELNITFPDVKIRQGTIQQVELNFDQEFAQKIEVQSFKGQKLGSAFYLYNLGPIMRKDGVDNLSAKAKVIVISEPKGLNEKIVINGQPANLKWNTINFEKVETPKELLFANFSIPAMSNYIAYIILFVLMALIGAAVFYVRHIRLRKKLLKQKKDILIKRILGANSYDEVVEVWKIKPSALSVFPGLSDPYKELEKVLFQYQFKLVQTEKEKEAVTLAYREFCSQAKGVMDGV